MPNSPASWFRTKPINVPIMFQIGDVHHPIHPYPFAFGSTRMIGSAALAVIQDAILNRHPAIQIGIQLLASSRA
jgi:hypothetical protein